MRSPTSLEELHRGWSVFGRRWGQLLPPLAAYCAPCTMGISIPMRFSSTAYLSRYGLEDWARGRYEIHAGQGGACVDCGACESAVPISSHS